MLVPELHEAARGKVSERFMDITALWPTSDHFLIDVSLRPAFAESGQSAHVTPGSSESGRSSSNTEQVALSSLSERAGLAHVASRPYTFSHVKRVTLESPRRAELCLAPRSVCPRNRFGSSAGGARSTENALCIGQLERCQSD